jgi:hypothetical protein
MLIAQCCRDRGCRARRIGRSLVVLMWGLAVLTSTTWIGTCPSVGGLADSVAASRINLAALCQPHSSKDMQQLAPLCASKASSPQVGQLSITLCHQCALAAAPNHPPSKRRCLVAPRVVPRVACTQHHYTRLMLKTCRAHVLHLPLHRTKHH